MEDRTRERVLLVNVLVVAVCALVYELLCGTLASYLLGDAVLQFALVLGTYLFAMGAGAWLSKRLEARAAAGYVHAELLLALVGGASVPLLLVGTAAHVPLRPMLYAVVSCIGVLVGLELPLLVHVLRGRRSFAETIARAFAFDYVGALAASLLFPLVLVPRLGLVRTAAATAALNALAALSASFVLPIPRAVAVRTMGAALLVVLAVFFFRGEAWIVAEADR